MMRRLCTILPILLIINTVAAAPVSVDKAAAVAASLFGRNTQKSTSTVDLKHVGVFNGDTVYYVFAGISLFLDACDSLCKSLLAFDVALSLDHDSLSLR